MKFALATLCALLAPTAAVAAGPCYTVYAADNSVVYRADEPPIDLSKPISIGMAERFPGGHLVLSSNTPDCPPLSAASTPPAAGRVVSESPALRMADEYVGSRLRKEKPRSANPAPRRSPLGDDSRAKKEVNVAAYAKADGTLVPAHTRAAPGGIH